jgi:hypothetical protein
MINRVTGEIDFRNGLRILPHSPVESLNSSLATVLPVKSERLLSKAWRRHVLGFHESEHGTFEVEALSAEDGCVHIVLLSHKHPFYERTTSEDAERRAFHEGVVSLDLGGQREFTWGEIMFRLEAKANQDWLIVAYNRESRVPAPPKEILLCLFGHEKPREDG